MTTRSDMGPRPGILVEACVASVADAQAAVEGGAHRLELNRALDQDGLTPNAALFAEVRAATPLPVIVMVRPHDNGFVYSDDEVSAMLSVVPRFVADGAAGVAVGPLTSDGRIDTGQLFRFMDVAGDADIVFHRAFDRLRDMGEALERLVEVGVTRVLTSGGAPTAAEGIATLSSLVAQAGDRIEILPGAGVGPSNVTEIIRGTGCSQLHGTFRARLQPEAGTSAEQVAAVCARAAAAVSPGAPAVSPRVPSVD